jgi:hypothetical protein
MTKLIILLCFSFGRVAGQTVPCQTCINQDSSITYLCDTGLAHPIYDTIPVIMLVGDTANHTEVFEHGIDFSHAKRSGIGWTGAVVIYDTVQWRSQKVEQVAGYEVREKNPTLEQTYHGNLAIAVMSWVDHFTHIAYLDEKKKPIKLYVWQTAKP